MHNTNFGVNWLIFLGILKAFQNELINFCFVAGLDINVCPIPVETDVGQVDLVLRLSNGTSEKIRFPNVPV